MKFGWQKVSFRHRHCLSIFLCLRNRSSRKMNSGLSGSHLLSGLEFPIAIGNSALKLPQTKENALEVVTAPEMRVATAAGLPGRGERVSAKATKDGNTQLPVLLARHTHTSGTISSIHLPYAEILSRRTGMAPLTGPA